MSLTLERSFTAEPLSPVLGASIVGLDLREPLPEAVKRAVYDAFIRYHVLCFRDQHLDHDQQIALFVALAASVAGSASLPATANSWT